MKHSDWLLQIVWLVLTNQSALFEHSYAALKFVYDIGSWFFAWCDITVLNTNFLFAKEWWWPLWEIGGGGLKVKIWHFQKLFLPNAANLFCDIPTWVSLRLWFCQPSSMMLIMWKQLITYLVVDNGSSKKENNLTLSWHQLNLMFEKSKFVYFHSKIISVKTVFLSDSQIKLWNCESFKAHSHNVCLMHADAAEGCIAEN